MEVIRSQNIVRIIRRALNFVDPRLIGHGGRVAYFMSELLPFCPEYSEKDRLDLTILGILHDVGAYKTEDIDDMVRFESENIWEHSLYGTLFLRCFTPLAQWSDAVLYHHLPYQKYPLASSANCLQEKHPAGLVFLADRMDMILSSQGTEFCLKYLHKQKGRLFSPYWADLFLKADQQHGILKHTQDGSWEKILENRLDHLHFSKKEKDQFLSMIAYSIDFRSEFMVLHTITTVSVSRVLSELLTVSNEEQKKIYYAALLHDVGKVATPIEILEKPGKLTPEETIIMQRHVTDTRRILEHYLEPDITDIAARHHEKLDGSGYPDGLSDADLTLNDKILAVSDILSALIRKRSYKEAFEKETVIRILTEMKDQGKISPLVTDTAIAHYDQIIKISSEYGKEILNLYQKMQEDYHRILRQIPDRLKPAGTAGSRSGNAGALTLPLDS